MYFRSASLRGFRSVVAELGGQADTFAEGAGLDPRALDQDDVLVEAHRSAAMLELVVEELGCHDLGLQMADRQSITVLGALAIALMNCPTLGSALDVVNTYLFVHSQFVSFELRDDPREEPGVSALYYRPARPRGPAQAVDLAMGFIHRGITHLSDGDYGLREVMLPYECPARTDIYEEFFGAKVTFRAPVEDAAVLRIPSSLPSRSLAGGDEALKHLAVAFLDRTTSRADDDLVERTRGALRHLLGTGFVDQAAVAKVFSIHPRTLHRRLAAHGTTYQTLVDEARRDQALLLVTTTDLPFGQITHMCGFREQASFTRAARRWWGASPRQLRSRQRAGAGARYRS